MAGEYIINYSADTIKPAFTILPRATNNDTSLTLFGKGAPNYGEGLQENLVHILENFCSDTPPALATLGQLWYKHDSSELCICTSTLPDEWTVVGIKSSATSPVNASIGTLWFDISNGILKYWDGLAWIDVSGAQASVNVGSIAPIAPIAGTLWVDTAVGLLNYWSGTAWVPVATNDAQTAYLAALMLLISPTKATYLSTITSNVQLQIDTLRSDMTTLIGNATTSVAGKVDKAGDSMTGFLSLIADPLTDLQAATKAYVDAAIFSALQVIGGTNGSIQQTILEVYAATAGQTSFLLPSTPYPDRVLYIAGVKQTPSSYTLVGTNLVLGTPVALNTEITIDSYLIGNTPGISALVKQSQTATAGQTVVTLTSPYIVGNNTLFVFINGIKQKITTAYTETSTTSITLTSPLLAGDIIDTIEYELNGTASLRYVPFVATSGQTVLPIVPAYHHTTSPTDPLNVNILIFVSGVAQGLNEYTETNGTSIVLAGGLTTGTVVEVYVFNIN